MGLGYLMGSLGWNRALRVLFARSRFTADVTDPFFNALNRLSTEAYAIEANHNRS